MEIKKYITKLLLIKQIKMKTESVCINKYYNSI